MKRLGILGGIGAESSAVFYSKLIEEFKYKYTPSNNTDFPRIVINSIPAPELTSGENSEKLSVYIKGLKFLEGECDFIVIVCNTAYVYKELFQKEISKPIIDLISFVEPIVANYEFVLVLGSPNTVQSEIFGFENCIYPSEDEQARIGDVINTYNIGLTTENDKQDIIFIIENYPKATAILVGCTELSLILSTWSNKPKIDTLNVLITETLNSL